MSRIYFHSPDETAEVRGAERFHLGYLVSQSFLTSLGPILDLTDDSSWVRKLFPPGHYIHSTSGERFRDTARTALGLGHDPLYVGGAPREAFAIQLNTALVLGGDSMRLAARLHGQCEIHCWVAGPNRRWFGTMIAIGRRDGVLRPDMGWEPLMEMLARRDDYPVVCSYSVCSQFPNHGISDWAGDGDEWDALPREHQWELGVEGLASEGRRTLEMKPDNWEAYRFDDGLNGFQLHELVAGP